MAARASAILPATTPPPPPALVAATATDVTGRLEIARRLRSAAAICYPYAAVRSNLEGTTRLRFCIGEKGEPREVQVVGSSGAQVLDSAAVDCVLPSAAPFPATSRLCVTVPVRFELQR
jgi:TonB family protein